MGLVALNYGGSCAVSDASCTFLPGQWSDGLLGPPIGLTREEASTVVNGARPLPPAEPVWLPPANRPPVQQALKESVTTSWENLEAFVAAACEVVPSARVAADELYEAYLEWTVREGRSLMPFDRFNLLVGRRFHRSRTKLGKTYNGLRLSIGGENDV